MKGDFFSAVTSLSCVLVIITGIQSHEMPIVNIEDHCKKFFFVDQSLRLHASRGTTVAPNLHCPVFLMSSRVHTKLMILIQNVNLTCETATLKIFNSIDTNSKKLIQGTGGGLCGQIASQSTFVSTDEGITVMLTTSSYGQGSVDMIITAYTLGVCSGDMMRCTNNRCISSKLKCDGLNNCGDNSDETQCNGSAGHAHAATTSITYTSLMLGILLMKYIV